VWLPILHGIVLPLRGRSSARLYARIWTPEGSPLLVEGRAQRDALASRLGPGYRVALGMRYGAPSIASALAELVRGGCRTVVGFPLFPQESFSTTGSVRAALELAARGSPAAPVMRIAGAFPEDEAYVRALAERVRAARGDAPLAHYVFSFHGLPQKSIARGDPYLAHCQATSRALARALGLAEGEWTLAFQSRFGRGWLQPFTDQVARSLARGGGRVLVTMPGFAVDCLETLEEIGIRLRETFHAAGGRELVVVPALNDHPSWIEALADLVQKTAMNAAS
jgi:ferrochelatase